MRRLKVDKADQLFSLWVRTRDNWTCQRCGMPYKPPTSGLHCSHFVGRGKEATRFEPLNADALDYGCHQYFTSHPAEHYAWQIKRKGQETVDKLVLLGNSYKKKDRSLEVIYWRTRLKEDFGITA